MKKQYEAPEFQLDCFNSTDVIALSEPNIVDLALQDELQGE